MGIPDYKQKDYKSFVFVSYEDFGLLLLYCTRKPLKGPYFQLPGGHVDDIDFEKVGEFMMSCCCCFILMMPSFFSHT